MSAPINEDAVNYAARRRWKLLLSGLLMALCWLQLQRVSDRLPAGRADLSEDRLASFSPAAKAILDQVDGSVTIEAFLTTSSQSGSVVVLMRRMLDQLDELERLGGGKVTVVVSDPSRSTEAQTRARALGIRPAVQDFTSGTRTVTEEIYLGVVVRHAGRSRTYGQLLPNNLEYALLQAVDDLSQPARRVLGWMPGADLATALAPARAQLSRRFDVRDVRGLESGVAVDADIDLIVLAGPRDLHPRAAYELERWLRAGGRMAVFADRTRLDLQTGLIEEIETGFGEQLKVFGLMPDRRVVWDRELPSRGTGGAEFYPMPLLTSAVDGAGGILPGHPIGAAQPQIWLQLVHPLKGVPAAGAPVPDVFLSSSDTAFQALPAGRLETGQRALKDELNTLLARTAPERFVLGATLVGELGRATDPVRAPAAAPLPGAPEPEGGWPPLERDARGEVEVSESRLVVIGDVNWLVPQSPGQPSGLAALLLENTVDWLAARPELIQLRSKQPTPRPLRDFEREAFEALDRESVLVNLSLSERRAIERSAGRARWGAIAAAFGGSLALLVGLFAIQRRPRVARVELADGRRGGQA